MLIHIHTFCKRWSVVWCCFLPVSIPNVKKEANISKFSKIDDIATRLRLLESFFDDTLVDTIVGYTKLYGNREKAQTCLKLIMKNFAYSEARCCLLGAISFETVKCAGKHPPIILYKQCQIQCFVTCLTIFFKISIFVTMKNLINKINSWSSFPWLLS